MFMYSGLAIWCARSQGRIFLLLLAFLSCHKIERVQGEVYESVRRKERDGNSDVIIVYL